MERAQSRQHLPPGSPIVRGNVVVRRRLLKRMESAIDVGTVCVKAAAGSGKSTLVATWLDTLPSSTQTVWLTLRPEHNDSIRLADDLHAHLLEAGLGVAGSVRSLEDVLANLLEHAPTSPIVLVLDDVHVIHSGRVTDAVGSILGQLPAGSCLVVCGQEDAGLPWAVLRERRAVVEIRDADLQFDDEETRRLLHDVFGIDVEDPRVATAVAVAEGWAAGLVLAGVALHAQPASIVEISQSPKHRQFVDGFIDEAILATCSSEVRDFLDVTSILPILEPAMCDVLTGRENSGAILRELVDRSVLTEELAGPTPTFRYHALLRRALQERQSRQTIEKSADRVELVIQELAAQGRLVEATDLALQSGPPDDALKWVRQSCGEALACGYAATVVRWLSALPADRLRNEVGLLLVRARAAGLTGDLLTAKAAVRAVRRVTEDSEPAPGVRVGLQLLDTGVGLWEGSLAGAVSSLQELLPLIPERADDPVLSLLGFTRSSLLSTIAAGLLMQGQLDEAVTMSDQVLELNELSPLTRQAVLSLGVRPLAMAWMGREQEAAAEIEAAMPLMTSWRAEANEAILFWVAASWVGPTEQAERSLAVAQRLTSRTAVPLLKALPAVAEIRLRQRLAQYDRLPESVRGAERAMARVPEPGYLAQVLGKELERAQQLPGPQPDLTEQELAILQELAMGRSRKEVAQVLHYSVNTVKTYLRSAYRKLGVGDRGDALDRAQAWGLLEQPTSLTSARGSD